MLEYFISKKNKKKILEEVFIQKIGEIGYDKEKSKDILIKMDDEWTKEQLHLENEKKAKFVKYCGIFLLFLGLFLSIVSFFIHSSLNILFIGFILGGVLSYYQSSSIYSTINKKRQLRKLEIKRW